MTAGAQLSQSLPQNSSPLRSPPSLLAFLWLHSGPSLLVLFQGLDRTGYTQTPSGLWHWPVHSRKFELTESPAFCCCKSGFSGARCQPEVLGWARSLQLLIQRWECLGAECPGSRDIKHSGEAFSVWLSSPHYIVKQDCTVQEKQRWTLVGLGREQGIVWLWGKRLWSWGARQCFYRRKGREGTAWRLWVPPGASQARPGPACGGSQRGQGSNKGPPTCTEFSLHHCPEPSSCCWSPWCCCLTSLLLETPGKIILLLPYVVFKNFLKVFFAYSNSDWT